MSPEIVVQRWLAAVNAGDADEVLALSDPEVLLTGPRGAARGHEVLCGWLAHAGATFETRALFARDGAVVVAQRGVWRGAEPGGAPGAAEVATRFRVAGGRVVELERFAELDDALRASALSLADRVPAG
jgi:ketosteroid isomerase-like protein